MSERIKNLPLREEPPGLRYGEPDPRVEFYGDGHSMSIRSAVSRFDAILKIQSADMAEMGLDKVEFTITVELRPHGDQS